MNKQTTLTFWICSERIAGGAVIKGQQVPGKSFVINDHKWYKINESAPKIGVEIKFTESGQICINGVSVFGNKSINATKYHLRINDKVKRPDGKWDSLANGAFITVTAGLGTSERIANLELFLTKAPESAKA